MPRVVWSSIATTGPMGQQRYEMEIQSALRAEAEDWEFVSRRLTSLRSSIRGARKIPARMQHSGSALMRRSLSRYAYGRADLAHRFDLRLIPAPGREVVTVHDLPPLRFDDEGELSQEAAASARRARRIIVPSEFAAKEVRELLGVEAIDVIPYGVSDDYSKAEPATDDQLAALGVRSPFVLHAAGASHRKNLPALAEAWGKLTGEMLARDSDLQLVLCGPPDERRDALFAGLPRVLKPGRLESDRIAGLMRRAEAVVVPSIYEGFGLPALEGMVCGTPVVAARRGALPEVCGDAAVLTEPDGGALANGLLDVLTNRDLAVSLRAAGVSRAQQFSWQKAARDHLRVYREALA